MVKRERDENDRQSNSPWPSLILSVSKETRRKLRDFPQIKWPKATDR